MKEWHRPLYKRSTWYLSSSKWCQCLLRFCHSLNHCEPFEWLLPHRSQSHRNFLCEIPMLLCHTKDTWIDVWCQCRNIEFEMTQRKNEQEHRNWEFFEDVKKKEIPVITSRSSVRVRTTDHHVLCSVQITVELMQFFNNNRFDSLTNHTKVQWSKSHTLLTQSTTQLWEWASIEKHTHTVKLPINDNKCTSSKTKVNASCCLI